MTLLNHEENGQLLDQFFIAVDTIVKPYFDKYFFKRKKFRNRGVVVFEKIIKEEDNISVDYCSYIPYGIPAFRVTLNSPSHFLKKILSEEGESNEQWRYSDKDDMENQLKNTIEKLELELGDLL